jgi:heme exporter protein D
VVSPPCKTHGSLLERAVAAVNAVGEMEWLTLFTWFLVVALAIGAASAATPSLGAQMLAAMAAFGLTIVFAAGGGDAFAWIAVGLGCCGVALLSIGAWSLVQDAPLSSVTRRSRREASAGFAGFELPFFMIAVALSVVYAIG